MINTFGLHGIRDRFCVATKEYLKEQKPLYVDCNNIRKVVSYMPNNIIRLDIEDCWLEKDFCLGANNFPILNFIRMGIRSVERLKISKKRATRISITLRQETNFYFDTSHPIHRTVSWEESVRYTQIAASLQ